MKKSIKYLIVMLLTLAFVIMVAPNVQAKQMTAEDIKNISAFDSGSAFRTVYIFGKHVYFNNFTMADAESAANTLGGATDAIMYFKNGANNWTRATTNEAVDTTNLKFEMIKLVGEKGENEHVSEVNNLYESSAYIETDTLPDGRIADIFIDETIEPMTTGKIVGIRTLGTEREIDADPEEKEIHKYNTENLTVEFDDENQKLALKEIKPLLTYKNSVDYGQWFGLLVRVDSSTTIEEILNGEIKMTIINPTPVVGNSDGYFHRYKVDTCDVEQASTFDGQENEFIVWLDADRLKSYINNSDWREKLDDESTWLSLNDLNLRTNQNNESKLVLSDDQDNLIQKIDITYSLNAHVYFGDYSNEEPVIKDITNGVQCEILTFDQEQNKYAWFFYGDDETETEEKTFSYTMDGKKYVAIYDGSHWKSFETIEPVEPMKANSTTEVGHDEHKWNQEAFTVATVPTPNKENSYDITITKNKVFEKYENPVEINEHYALIMDLGIDPHNLSSENSGELYNYKIEDIDISDVDRHLPEDEESTGTQFVMWLCADKDYTITFNNKPLNEAAVGVELSELKDTFTLNIKVDDDIQYLELTANLGAAVNLNGNENDLNNNLFKENMNNLELLGIPYNEETDTYTVSIRANDLINSFVGGQGESHKWFSLITDFGVNPTFLEADHYSIEPIDISDVERHLPEGVQPTGTQFVLWGALDLDKFNDETFTFTDKDTHDTVNVKFAIQDVEKFDDAGLENVSIPEDKIEPPGKRVRYREEKDYYIIDEGTEKFEAEADDKVFIYKKDDEGWKKSQKLVLTKVLPGRADLTEYSDEQKNNQKAIQDITLDGNTVNIKMAHKLNSYDAGGQNKSWYGLVIDLGVVNENIGTTADCGYKIEDVDKSEAHRHVDEENPSGNYLVLWLNTEATGTADGKEIVFTNTDDPSIEYPITFKSTVEELRLNKLAKLDTTNISDRTDSNGNNIKSNNENFAIVEDGDTYEIAYQHPFISFNNSHADRHWFGFMLNLNLKPEFIEGDGYGIEDVDRDPEQVRRFGGSGNDFIVWLSTEDLPNNSLELKFKNKFDGENTVTINLKLTNVDLHTAKLATPIDLDDEEMTAFHNLNQSAYCVDAFPSDGEKAVINISPKHNALNPIAYDNGFAKSKWIAVLVDFGVDPNKLESEEYTINPEDIEQARRHGATSDTEFVMWIDAETEREINFKYAESDLIVKLAIECKPAWRRGTTIVAKGERHQIGEEVSYSPDGETTSVVSPQTANGDSDQTITRNNNTSWVLLGLDEENPENVLITTKAPATNALTIKGATAYNKGPGEFDRICETLFSKGNIKARSMNLKDVYDCLEFVPKERLYYTTNKDNTDNYTLGQIQTPVKNLAELKEQETNLWNAIVNESQDYGTPNDIPLEDCILNRGWLNLNGTSLIGALGTKKENVPLAVSSLIFGTQGSWLPVYPLATTGVLPTDGGDGFWWLVYGVCNGGMEDGTNNVYLTKFKEHFHEQERHLVFQGLRPVVSIGIDELN